MPKLSEIIQTTKQKSYYPPMITSHYFQIRKNSKEAKRRWTPQMKKLKSLKMLQLRKNSSLNCIPCYQNHKLKWRFLRNISLQDFKIILSCAEFTHQLCISFCRWELSIWRVLSKILLSLHLCRASLQIFGIQSPNFLEFSLLMVHLFSWKFLGEQEFTERTKPLF